MSDSTPRLRLSELVSMQEMNVATWNEALVQLDAFVDLYLLGQFVNTPPGSPADGDAYLLGGSPTGAWSGYAYKIASCIDGAWRFYTPFNGLRAYVATTGAFIVYVGGTWTDWSSRLPQLSVNLGGTSQTGLSVGYNKIAFSNIVIDTNGWWDASNKRYIPQQAGTYLVILAEYVTGTGLTQTSDAALYKNGSKLSEGTYTNGLTSGTVANSCVLDLIEMNGTTDYIEGWAYCPTGAALIGGQAADTYMRILRVK